MPEPTKDDKELLELLTKLYDMQEAVGAKPKSSAEDKRSRAESTTMGRGRAAKKAGSRFLELKSNMVDRLKTIHSLLEEESARVKGTSGAVSFSVVSSGNNPKEIIARQARIREELKQGMEEWEELDRIYKNEAKKKRSKFSQEELNIQQTLVQRLYAELKRAEELQSQNYARTGRDDRDDAAIGFNTQAVNIHDIGGVGAADWAGGGGGGGDGTASFTSNGFGGNGGGGGGVELTQQQHLQLEEIQNRDKDFDKQLDMIGEGIQDLADIAKMQNEEVRRQNAMLENVGAKIDSANEHITNINSKMKETLSEVRGADKICVDIMCIVMMVGLGAVLYQMVKSSL